MWKIWRIVLIVGTGAALAHCTGPEESPVPPGQPGAGESADVAPPPAADTRSLDQSFADIDTDGDGFLSREEARSAPALRDIFALADRDQDGKLNVPEYSHATLEGTRVSPDAAGGPLFLELDVDENGRITPEEAAAVPQLERNFETFDADGNGDLDVQEYSDARDEGLTPPQDDGPSPATRQDASDSAPQDDGAAPQ
jgi:Ca2+-binding EF-hand superfamily protein